MVHAFKNVNLRSVTAPMRERKSRLSGRDAEFKTIIAAVPNVELLQFDDSAVVTEFLA